MDGVIEFFKSALDEMNEKYCRLAGGRFQERPICYEFYHQLRKLIDEKRVDFGRPVVQAEVSKRYQHYSVLGKGGKQPDFIIHVPDSRKKNFAVIEFKMASRGKSVIEKDLKKLRKFGEEGERKLGYTHLVEVIVGNEKPLAKVRQHIKSLQVPKGKEIIVIEFDVEKWKPKDWKIKYPARASPPNND